MTSPREYCVKCCEATGKAGFRHGSLFLPGGDGPLCDECYDEWALAQGNDKWVPLVLGRVGCWMEPK